MSDEDRQALNKENSEKFNTVTTTSQKQYPTSTLRDHTATPSEFQLNMQRTIVVQQGSPKRDNKGQNNLMLPASSSNEVDDSNLAKVRIYVPLVDYSSSSLP